MDETASTLCEVIKYLRVDTSERAGPGRGGLRRNKSVVVRNRKCEREKYLNLNCLS